MNLHHDHQFDAGFSSVTNQHGVATHYRFCRCGAVESLRPGKEWSNRREPSLFEEPEPGSLAFARNKHAEDQALMRRDLAAIDYSKACNQKTAFSPGDLSGVRTFVIRDYPPLGPGEAPPPLHEEWYLESPTDPMGSKTYASETLARKRWVDGIHTAIRRRLVTQWEDVEPPKFHGITCPQCSAMVQLECEGEPPKVAKQ